MTSITSIQSLILDLPPSCIEFCPVARDYFVVGTYFLEKKEQDAGVENATEDEEEKKEDVDTKPQTRTGSLVLLKVEGDEVITISTTPTPYATLDLHFSPHDPTLLAVAGSTGCLQLFRFSSATTSLEPLSTYQFFDPATLVLSLSWHPINANLLGVTVSEGGVYVINTDVAVDAALDTGKEVLAHDLEAWTLVFAHDGKAIYSGGDDASLRFSTLPDPTTSSSSFSPSKTPEEGNKQDEENGEEDQEDFTPLQWQDRRSHQAGVTAILPLASENNILITGSYDDNIRILHAPLVGRKQVLCEENLEGGVWRLKLLKEETEQKRYTILASCMHAGARIVQIRTDEEEQWGIEVLAKFEEHKSMNYGSDAQPRGSGNGEDGGKQTIVSTSFYDKLLCLWRF